MPLHLTAYHDTAGDGWIDLHLHPPSLTLPIRGFRLDNVRACSGASCTEVAVFGSSSGAAEEAGWLVAAGHAFTHGVYGLCFTEPTDPGQADPCVLQRPAGDGPLLLATLSVAIPLLGKPATRVCTDGGLLYGAGAAYNISARCAPALGELRSPWSAASPSAAAATAAASSPPRRPPRGVAFVKTYKTGSSTIGSLLHRYAETHALDVAVNAKAVPHDGPLEGRLEKREKRARPTDCLYEFHSFKSCGQAWLQDQATTLGLGADAPARWAGEPKPLQLVVDHSRLQPLKQLDTFGGGLFGGGGGGGGGDAGLPLPCRGFLAAMRAAQGRVHELLRAPRSLAAYDACIEAVAKHQQRVTPTPTSSSASSSIGGGGGDLLGVDAYRSSVPGGLLVTSMRWPASRFVSAMEQFNIPPRMGVPCRRRRKREGGACRGHTCERDFDFTWACLNTSVERSGMLATYVRCIMDTDRPKELRRKQIDDLKRIAAAGRGGAGGSGSGAGAADEEQRSALAQLQRQLELQSAQCGSGGGGGGGGAGGGCGRRRRTQLCGASAKFGQLMPDSRFVMEAVAKTLGFPRREFATPKERDNWHRMLGDDSFAAVAFAFVAALRRSIDLVLVTEHIDESLLMLRRAAGWSNQDVLYISQKRRKQNVLTAAAARGGGSKGGGGGGSRGGGGGGGGNVGLPSPAAKAASSGRLHTVLDTPSVAALRAPAAPWLWPHELDTVLRANWLDTLLHVHFNRTLWRRVEQTYGKGSDGEGKLRGELAQFRALRATVLRRCAACERDGVGRCLARAHAAAGGGGTADASAGAGAGAGAMMQPEVTPHLCWMLSQDTKAWSEHFFSRMALRFDARATLADAAAAAGSAAGGGGGGLRTHAGVRTGNVRWWRCPRTRGVAPNCARIPPGSAHPKYSAWNCMCSWRETQTQAGPPRRWKKG